MGELVKPIPEGGLSAALDRAEAEALEATRQLEAAIATAEYRATAAERRLERALDFISAGPITIPRASDPQMKEILDRIHGCTECGGDMAGRFDPHNPDMKVTQCVECDEPRWERR